MNWRDINPPKEYDDEDLIYLGRASLASRRVNQAVKNGTMTRSEQCEVCGKKTKTHGHHWNGHENCFDVWWVCQRCNNALRSYHDGSLSIEDARKMVVGRYFKRIEHYQKWRDRQIDECAACGVQDSIGNMVVLYDEYEEDFIMCHSCWSQSFAATQHGVQADGACMCGSRSFYRYDDVGQWRCCNCHQPRR